MNLLREFNIQTTPSNASLLRELICGERDQADEPVDAIAWCVIPKVVGIEASPEAALGHHRVAATPIEVVERRAIAPLRVLQGQTWNMEHDSKYRYGYTSSLH